MAKKGILLVISGPSGSGKGDLVKLILSKREDFSLSVSATTRAPRSNDIDGVTYHFISREEFEARIAAGELLEYNLYNDNLYGTLKSEVIKRLDEGMNIILEIDVNGALNIKKIYPDAVLVMVAPPNFNTLEKRLRGRGDNVTEDVILGRLNMAKSELSKLGDYDYIVINEDGQREKAADEIISIIDSERHKTKWYTSFISDFYEE